MTAAGERGPIIMLANVDVVHDLVHGVFVDNRADFHFRIGAVADAQSLRALDQLPGKLAVHFLVNYQTRGRSAALSGSTERAPERAFDSVINVSIIQDDDCVLAAHLQRTDRVAFGAGVSDSTARLSRAGERN